MQSALTFTDTLFWCNYVLYEEVNIAETLVFPAVLTWNLLSMHPAEKSIQNFELHATAEKNSSQSACRCTKSTIELKDPLSKQYHTAADNVK
jgi:hypothetical protein